MDWFITDHLGSTKLLIDQNGTHKFTGDDDPFGINLRSFGDKDSHRYTGQILNEEQGVYYYGARYYLPEIGRFLSGDPMAQYHSLYCYVSNNAPNQVDPDGRQSPSGFLPLMSSSPNATQRELGKHYMTFGLSPIQTTTTTIVDKRNPADGIKIKSLRASATKRVFHKGPSLKGEEGFKETVTNTSSYFFGLLKFETENTKISNMAESSVSGGLQLSPIKGKLSGEILDRWKVSESGISLSVGDVKLIEFSMEGGAMTGAGAGFTVDPMKGRPFSFDLSAGLLLGGGFKVNLLDGAIKAPDTSVEIPKIEVKN